MTSRFRDRFALLCLSTAAAAASGAAVMMFDREHFAPQVTAEIKAPAPTKLQDRLPYVGATETQDKLVVASTAASSAQPDPIEETLAQAETADTAESPEQEAEQAEAAPQQEATQHDAAQHDPGTEASSWQAQVATPAAKPNPRVAVNATVKLPWQTQRVTAATQTKTYTLSEKIAELSPAATKRIKEKFDAAKVSYPPAELGLVAIKDEKVLELHARSISGEWQFVHRYKILAASGKPGPKLKKGDYQVPEGVYGIAFLNPNSKYHVAMRVDYPNAFDKEMAAKDGRTALGGDIMIHGKNSSRGCLAMGDDAAEELFVLSESIGLPKVKLVIAPVDFRKSGIPAPDDTQPKWTPQLYTNIAAAMTPLKAPPSNSLLSLLGW